MSDYEEMELRKLNKNKLLTVEQRTWYCTNCKKDTEHLAQILESIWYCVECKKFYTNKEFEESDATNKLFWTDEKETTDVELEGRFLPLKVDTGELWPEAPMRPKHISSQPPIIFPSQTEPTTQEATDELARLVAEEFAKR